jgi:spermidine synthase
MAKQMIAVSEERGVRYLHFGTHWIQGAMRISRPDTLVLDYTRAMMAVLLLLPRPGSALVIGLGAGSVAKFLHRYFPDMRVTVVEINPKVIDVAREYFYLPADSSRFSIEVADGFEFVQTSRRRFDLLLVDGFDHNARAGPLESLPFYLACSERLSQHGAMAVNLLGNSRGYKATVKRIKAAFTEQALPLSPCKDGNVIVFGLRGGSTRRRATQLAVRAQALHAQTNLNLAFAIPDLTKER